MPDFKLFLSRIRTSLFYFLDVHEANLTKKWDTLDILPLGHS